MNNALSDGGAQYRPLHLKDVFYREMNANHFLPNAENMSICSLPEFTTNLWKTKKHFSCKYKLRKVGVWAVLLYVLSPSLSVTSLTAMGGP